MISSYIFALLLFFLPPLFILIRLPDERRVASLHHLPFAIYNAVVLFIPLQNYENHRDRELFKENTLSQGFPMPPSSCSLHYLETILLFQEIPSAIIKLK